MAREMKDSGVAWIGEIPKHWELSKLKSYTSMLTPMRDKPEHLDGDIPWIRIEDYSGKYISSSKEGLGVSTSTIQAMNLKIYPVGTILCTSSCDLGKCAIVARELVSNQRFIGIIPNKGTSPDFLYYLMLSNAERLNFLSTGSIQANLSRVSFEQLYIQMPPYSEQQRIAAYLDNQCARIDGILEKTRTSIEEYKNLKQAIITQAVTKGIRGDRPMKESGIDWLGMIPSDWEICRMKDVGTLQNGISKGGEFFGTGYPFVSYGDVYRSYELPREVKGLVESTSEERERYSVIKGDIFFTRTSETIEEIGYSSVCLETIPSATFAGFLIRVRPFNDKLNVHFSKYYFRSQHHRIYFTKQMNLVTRASLGQSLLKSLPVLIPPKQEQVTISAYLDEQCRKIDTLICKKEELIANLEQFKRSLIYEYVTGKKEAPDGND